jgi:GAF domain-containing protein
MSEAMHISLFDGSVQFGGSSASRLPSDVDAETFAAALAELTVAVKREGVTDEQHSLDAITEAAVALIDGAECSAIVVLARPGRLTARSVHGELPPFVMGLQNEVGEGPCLDAVSQTSQVAVRDIRSELRWPAFSAQVSRFGVGSMLCTPLTAEDRILGSLTLASTRPNAFDEDSVGLAAVFATHAAIALVGANHVRGLTAMASSRDLIGQAKGILMERYKLSPDKAFAVWPVPRRTTTSNCASCASG